ncbi:MAG: hypothetical protein CMP58_02570 [Flavobacteriales bacterium]|nr:hypothetical protein [Flavobacteriales bacterium]
MFDSYFKCKNLFNKFKKMKFKILYIILFIIFFNSCDRETEIDDVCDNVSFINDVAPIIYNKCVSCHSVGQTAESAGIFGSLNNNEVYYNTVFAIKDIIISLVNSNDPNIVMPPTAGSQLNQNQIQIIQCWIDNGAIEN